LKGIIKMENNQTKTDKFEIVKFGPYRFIGKEKE
jgi:hypothetical protein